MSEGVAYVYAAVLDVLGYRDRLQRDLDAGSLAFKDELKRAMRVLDDVNEAVYWHQAVSDTLLLTSADRADIVGFLKVLKGVFLGFLQEGLFIRGGVIYEKHFKSSHVTYSHAVAKAYELESKLAIYPRILIDVNIIELARTIGLAGELEASKLVCEQNGLFFLNVVDGDNWERVYQQAKGLYQANAARLERREPEFAKHVWFERYLLTSPHAVGSAEPYMPGIRLLKM